MVHWGCRSSRRFHFDGGCTLLLREGVFPKSFKNLKSLNHFSISRNSIRNLSAVLTALQQCKNLTFMVLIFNFHGEIMPANSNFKFENIRMLVMENCRLMGLMSPWLSNSSKLQILDLSKNSLGGKIPPSVGALPYLFHLDLSNNSLSGSIPSSFTQFQSLVDLENTLKEEIFEGFTIFSPKDQSSGLRQYKQLLAFPPNRGSPEALMDKGKGEPKHEEFETFPDNELDHLE